MQASFSFRTAAPIREPIPSTWRVTPPKVTRCQFIPSAVGDPNALRDVELRFVRADEVALRGSTLKMSLTVKNRGFEDAWIKISVTDQNRRSWAAPQRKKIEKTDADQQFEVDVVADRVGRFELEVRVDGPPGEENKRNNVKTHVVTVKDDKIRVLYVDTLPRWEYRKLKNFLVRGDQSFVTQCLLLSAEPNFPQERTQSVPPLRDFPATFEELDKYDVLVFGDVDPNRLVATPSKLEGVLQNIQKFVDNGGGVAVLAGEGWTPQAYVDTPFEELLPVDVGSAGEFGPSTAYVDEWKPKLTAQGRSHPLMQIEKNQAVNRRAWEERDYGLMTLRWWYPVRRAMPAARVLAVHPDQRNQFESYPIMTVGTYGDGPVFFCAVDETWRWFHTHGAFYFNRFWGNVVRFLARAHLYRGSKRFKLVSNASEYQLGETAYLTAFVRDKTFEDATAPTQKVMIVEPNTKGRMVEFEKVSDGEYTWSFKPSRSGRVDAWIVGDDGMAGGKRYAPISFEVQFVDPERHDLAMDFEKLKEIASAGNGSYFPLHESDGLFERLRADTTQRRSVTPKPLRNRLWLPLIPLLLLTLEWLLRRRFRME